MENTNIIQGDCLQIISTIDDESIDCVITDPPYSSGAVLEAQKQSAGRQGIRDNVKTNQRFSWFSGNNMTTMGITYLIRNLGVEFERVCKEGASILVFCDWRMAINFVPALESCGLIYRNLIVWDKGHFGMGNGFRNQHELIIHLSKGSPNFYSASFANVLKCGRTHNQKERIHPTEKPVKLLSDLMQVVTKEGDLILDPFSGSGSMGEACIKNKRRFIGIEKNKLYYENSTLRLDEVKKEIQSSLFPNGFEKTEAGGAILNFSSTELSNGNER